MPEDMATWLDGLGLGEYAKAFAENAIEMDVLADLSEADFAQIGVKLGHRKKLMKAIAALPQAAAPAAGELPAREPEPLAHDESLAAWERHPGERKPVTMLFADITGSTALTEKLDAEETHDLLYGATQRMCEAIERNRGTVCRFMGDGVMAMFGAPVASEQHAVDACRAAMDMQEAVAAYAQDIATRHGADVQIRVGLHSGEVVVLTVGEGDKVEYDASGPTVPVAARMEQSATPGQIYITAATRSLAEPYVETETLAPVSVKGISAPLPVYRLRRVRSADEARHGAARTPFVGRRGDLIQFRGMLDTALEEGYGQTLYVRGEPGIGKTRLVEEFARVAAERGLSIHRGLVLPFGVGKGQDAIRSLVRSLLGVAGESDKSARAGAADEAIRGGRLAADQAVFLNDLLDLPQPTALRALYDAMDNATRNAGKRAVVASLVVTASGDVPVLVIVEDVHWADALTLPHLAALTQTVAECPALLIMTSRIEGDQLDRSWRGGTDGSPFVTIDLGPLRRDESIALIAEFLDADNPLAENCLERASGNPLFLEQLLRAAKEGSGDSLPDSIQSLVLARLDRLEADEKRALQAAAVMGQRFKADVLAHLMGTRDYDCTPLVDHDLVRPEGDGYLFAHALIQESVYGSLLKRQRHELHRRAADWYAGSDPGLFAEHLAGAEDARAPRAFLEAARDQTHQYRFDRALALTRHGLSVAKERTDRHELKCFEGELHARLADIQSSMDAYREALDAAKDDRERCDAWMGLAAGMRVLTRYDDALALLEKAEVVALREQRIDVLTRLYHMRGNLYFSQGRTEDCRDAHLRSLEHARQCGSAEGEARAYGGLGDAAYACGRMKTALQEYTRCIELSREHGFGRTEVAHLGQRVWTRIYTGDWADSESEALAAIEVAEKAGDRRAAMNASLCLCELSFDTGKMEQLEARAKRCLGLARSLGARAWEAPGLMWQAIALQAAGRQPEACEVMRQAAEITRESGRAFNGGRVLGAMAYVMAEDDAVRESALREGLAMLEENSISHNHFWFYRFAMDALLRVQDWDRVDRYAAALEDYTRDEPLWPATFFAARGRALAAFGRGARDAETIATLERLRGQARGKGLGCALQALEDALSRAGESP